MQRPKTLTHYTRWEASIKKLPQSLLDFAGGMGWGLPELAEVYALLGATGRCCRGLLGWLIRGQGSDLLPWSGEVQGESIYPTPTTHAHSEPAPVAYVVIKTIEYLASNVAGGNSSTISLLPWFSDSTNPFLFSSRQIHIYRMVAGSMGIAGVRRKTKELGYGMVACNWGMV